METERKAKKYILYDELRFEELRSIYLCVFLLFILLLIPVRRIIIGLGWYLPAKLVMMLICLPIMIVCIYQYKDFFMVVYVNSYDLKTILMPALIFHFTYTMDMQMIWNCKYQIIINTIRAILEAILLILLLRKLIRIGYYESISLGFIASIPLPLAILLYLENLGHYEYITVLLKMETIISITITDMVLICTTSEFSLTDHIGYYILMGCRHTLGAIAIGIVHGKLVVWILLQMQSEQINVLVMILSNMYISYGLIAPQAAVSCDLSTFIVGIIIASDKNKYSTELDKIISMVWDQIFIILDTFVLLTVSCFFFWFFRNKDAYKYHHYMALTYLSSNILRFLTYLMFMPIMRKLGQGINLRSLIVLSTAGIKDSVNLIQVLRLYEHITNDKLIHISLPLVFLSMLLNASTMPYLLKIMGLSDISITRKTNMNNCMRFIMDKRTRFIAALKLNRYLSDADWKTIQSTTIVVHPYKLNINDVEDVSIELLLNYCPYCKKDFPMELTKKERGAMLKEAHTRVLKAKQISFIRQYENGMLSKDGITILLRAIELASFTATKSNSELELLSKLANKGNIFRLLAKYLMKLWSDKEAGYNPPPIYYRKVAFYIVMHWLFDIVIYTTIIMMSIPTIILVVIDEPLDSSEILLYVLFTIGNLIFLAEFILKIIGFSETRLKDGFRNYFRSWWNVLDFIILIIAYADQIMATIDLLQLTDNAQAIRILRVFRLFRIIRIIRLFRGLQPKLVGNLEASIDLKMALAFDIAKGMLVALEEVGSQLTKMIDDEEIRKEIYSELMEVRESVHKHLTRIATERPWVSITVKTKQAIRTTLNSISEAINELKFSGYIDIQEHAKLIKSLEESNKVARRMRVIQRSLPKDIFKEVPWLAGDQDLTDFLFKRVEKKCFETDEYICFQNDVFDGIMVLVTGILSLKYVPSEVEHLQDLRDYGALPVVDFLASIHFDLAVQDYAVSGSSIGELCYLTRRYYCSTVTANAPSEVYLLTMDVMDEATQKYNDPIFGLESLLWKYVTFELVTKILVDTPVYASVHIDQVKTILERAFIPNIRNFFVLKINDLIEDIVLLEGLAADNSSKELYVAPCYINRHVQQLNFYKSSTIHFETKIAPKIMIIPVKDANEYEIMEKIEDYNELSFTGFDALCRIYNEASYSNKRRMKVKAEQIKKKPLNPSFSQKTLT